MRSDTQPDLLSWQASCSFLVFPLNRRVGKVRHVASILAHKHGKDAEAYWRQVTSGISISLDRIGMSDADKAAQIKVFFDAVQSELVRLHCVNRIPGGDVA